MYMVIKYGEDLGYMYYAIGPFDSAEAATAWIKDDLAVTIKGGEWTVDESDLQSMVRQPGLQFQWFVAPIAHGNTIEPGKALIAKLIEGMPKQVVVIGPYDTEAQASEWAKIDIEKVAAGGEWDIQYFTTEMRAYRGAERLEWHVLEAISPAVASMATHAEFNEGDR